MGRPELRRDQFTPSGEEAEPGRILKPTIGPGPIPRFISEELPPKYKPVLRWRSEANDVRREGSNGLGLWHDSLAAAFRVRDDICQTEVNVIEGVLRFARS